MKGVRANGLGSARGRLESELGSSSISGERSERRTDEEECCRIRHKNGHFGMGSSYSCACSSSSAGTRPSAAGGRAPSSLEGRPSGESDDACSPLGGRAELPWERTSSSIA